MPTNKVTKVKDPKAVERGKKAWQKTLEKHTAKILTEKTSDSTQPTGELSSSTEQSTRERSSPTTTPSGERSSPATSSTTIPTSHLTTGFALVGILAFVGVWGFYKCKQKSSK